MINIPPSWYRDAGTLAIWKETPGQSGQFVAVCGGGEGCRERLGSAEPSPERSDAPFSWLLEPGYVLAEDGYYRFSGRYADQHPLHSRWRRPKMRQILKEAASRVPLPLAGEPRFRKARWPEKVGSKSSIAVAGIAYIICKNKGCQAQNLVVPHLALRALPPKELRQSRCGWCPRCLVAGRECEGDECPDCASVGPSTGLTLGPAL